MTHKTVPCMLITRRGFLKLLGGSGTAAVLVACGVPGAEQEPEDSTTPEQSVGEPQRGGTLRVAFPQIPTFAEPTQMSNYADGHILVTICEGLTWVDTNLEPQPVLATDWEMADDGLSWTFMLREGVTFHHGTPFTADDVVSTYEHILDPDTGANFRNVISFIDRVEAVDDYTVRFHLNRPNTELPWITASPLAVILPQDRTPQSFIDDPVGTGPFRFSEYRPGEQTIFVRNEDYWDSNLPYLDELRHVYIPETATQVNALLGNTIDAIWTVGAESIAALSQDDAVQVIELPSGSYEVMVMQATETPFDDVRVRQALKHCVDREGMIQAVLQGRGVVANDQPFSPFESIWVDIPPLAYDTERAKELLAEAGYPDGLELTLHASDAIPGSVSMAVAFQEMAKPAGVTIQIEQVPAETFYTNYYMQVPFSITTWGMTVSTSTVLTLGYHSEAPFNESAYQNPELDALIDEVTTSLDETERAELYAQIQQIISEDGAVIIPYFKSVLSAARTDVQQFQPNHSIWTNFRQVWLSQA